MKRFTPIRRKTRLKRRGTLRRVSPQYRAELARYTKLKQSWLERAPFCECPQKGGGACHRRATGIHHIRGRGPWLCDTKYFLSVCSECHHWIHFINPREARKMGVLKT